MSDLQEKENFSAYLEAIRKIENAEIRRDVLKGFAQAVELEHGRKEIKERLLCKIRKATLLKLWPEYTWMILGKSK